MLESSITSKGQTTLPKDVRTALGIESGDRIRYILMPGGEVRLLKMEPLKRLVGMLAKEGREPVSLDDMDEAIAKEASR